MRVYIVYMQGEEDSLSGQDSPKISCQVSSKLTKHYRRDSELLLWQRRLQKVLNKRVPLTVANVY